jgi:hypothetical protein
MDGVWGDRIVEHITTTTTDMIEAKYLTPLLALCMLG